MVWCWRVCKGGPSPQRFRFAWDATRPGIPTAGPGSPSEPWREFAGLGAVGTCGQLSRCCPGVLGPPLSLVSRQAGSHNLSAIAHKCPSGFFGNNTALNPSPVPRPSAISPGWGGANGLNCSRVTVPLGRSNLIDFSNSNARLIGQGAVGSASIPDYPFSLEARFRSRAYFLPGASQNFIARELPCYEGSGAGWC